MISPMVDHQVYDLLFGQTCCEAKIGEGQVITGLRLVFEVLALAEPSLLEARISGHESIEKVVWHGRVRVNGKWTIGDLLPSRRDVLLLFGMRHALVFEEFHEVAWIVTAVSLTVDLASPIRAPTPSGGSAANWPKVRMPHNSNSSPISAGQPSRWSESGDNTSASLPGGMTVIPQMPRAAWTAASGLAAIPMFAGIPIRRWIPFAI